MLNILILSAGRRVKLIEYVKNELRPYKGKVIAADCDPNTPALYMADHFEILPKIGEKNYIEQILEICKQYEINAVISLIDPELSVLAPFKSRFSENGIELVLSDEDAIEICFDKYLTYQFLCRHGLPGVPTFINIDKVFQALENRDFFFPLVVKPRFGSASIGIRYIHSLEELLVFDRVNKAAYVIQPFIKGREIGADVYVDTITKETITIFLKRKLKMRAGETDKSVSIREPVLQDIVAKLMEVLKPVGPVDVDCFQTDEGFMISEINPRFGGGYPHAHESGCNFIKYILNNVSGIPNEMNFHYKAGVMMVKYENVMILDEFTPRIKSDS